MNQPTPSSKPSFARHGVLPTTLAAACLLLAACGGGGDDGPAAGATATAAQTVEEGRAQALAASHAALSLAPATLSGNVRCNNLVIGPLRLDSVSVPPGATCVLEGTALTGTLQVARDATLQASAVDVAGSLQADAAAHVALRAGSRIGGSVQISQGGSASVENSRITGDIQLDGLRGAALLGGNTVGGNVQAMDTSGGLAVLGNSVRGNLQCQGNQPLPLVSGNAAASFQDQCVQVAGGGSSGGGAPAPGINPPLSGNVTCNGLSLGAVLLDTVTVPAGASCTLDGTRLTGSLLAGAGAVVRASQARINGSVQADGAASVVLDSGSTVGGSVQIKQGGTATLAAISVSGDLQIDGLAGPAAASGNRIGGNLQAIGNRGGLTLGANTVRGVLECKDNLPAPTGAGNVASQKLDQCRGL